VEDTRAKPSCASGRDHPYRRAAATPNRPHSRATALLALAMLTLIWSYNWIVVKQALQHAAPIGFVAWRAPG